MEVEKKYYKLKLCNFYEKYGKCNKKYCTYAHGKDELREFKKECINGLKCFKENCNFNHPKGWKPEDNKNICEYYINGFCKNEDKCNFKHINEYNINKEDDEIDVTKNIKDLINNEDNIEELSKIIDINSNDEFPELKENDKNIKIDIKEDLSNKENKNFPKNINENNLYQNIEIFVDGIKYNNDDNLLDINKIDITENIKDLTNNFEETKNNNQENNKDEIEETQNIIIKLQENFEEYVREIKNNIDSIFIEDKKIYGINMKIELNKIMSEINLLKNNYQDIIIINNKK